MRRRLVCAFISLTLVGCDSEFEYNPIKYESRTKAEERLDPAVRVVDLDVVSDDRLVAVASPSSSYEERWAAISEDAGQTWKRVQPMGEATGIHVRSFAVTSKGIHLLTAAAVFRSQDGRSWQSAITAEKGFDYGLFAAGNEAWIGRRGGSLLSIDSGRKLESAGVVTAMIETASKTLLAGSFGKGVFRSTDGGATWQGSVLSTPDVCSLATLPNGDVLAGTFGGGVFRSADQGATWVASGQGLEDPEVQALVSVADGPVFAGAQRGLFRSDDGARTWKRVDGPIASDNINVLAATPKGVVLAGTWGNGLYRSVDRGSSWTLVDVRAAPPSITTISERPDGPIYAGMLTGEVYELTPEDGAWKTFGKMDASAVVRLTVAPDRKVYGSTNNKLYRFDGGAWVSFPFALPGKPIRGLAVDASGRVLAETFDMDRESQRVFGTVDMGRTWKALEGECLDGTTPPKLTADPMGTTLLQGCSCISQDGGKSWKRVVVADRHVCLIAAGSKHTVLAVSNNWSSAGILSLMPGWKLRDRLDIEAEPTCLGVLPDGTIGFAADRALMVLPPGKSAAEKRSDLRSACRQLVGRDDGSFVMLDEHGIHRSTDGAKTWARIDGLDREAK